MHVSTLTERDSEASVHRDADSDDRHDDRFLDDVRRLQLFSRRMSRRLQRRGLYDHIL